MNDLQIVLATLNPLVNKLQSLEEKVDRLSSDHATRSDIEKLRNELVGLFVPRESFEERHQALIANNRNIESSVRNNRDTIMDLIKAHEDEIKNVKLQIEESEDKFIKLLEESKENELTAKERLWVRWAYIGGFVSVIIAIADVVIQHIRIS